jgi:hypothetical protein
MIIVYENAAERSQCILSLLSAYVGQKICHRILRNWEAGMTPVGL